MKKIFIVITLVVPFFVCALSNTFKINTSKLNTLLNSENNVSLSPFREEYSLAYIDTKNDVELEQKITELTKKTTFLLLGGFNNDNESSEDYYKRHQEYLSLRYNPKVAKDDTTITGLDENSQEYKDDLVSGLAVPSMFNKMNELDIIFSSIGDIRISNAEKTIISTLFLPNVKIKEQNKNNPKKYDIVEKNLIIYYYFKNLDGQYKLYYLTGETTDDANDFLINAENKESKNMMQVQPIYNSSLKDIYDYSKAELVTNNEINNIYNSNKNNILILNAYYNNYLVIKAGGFFINDGLIVTTWSFLETALREAQYIAIKDNDGNAYEMDGIVTGNPDMDIAVIKLKQQNNHKVKLGDSSILKIEDPVMTISSKTGSGLTFQKGIIIYNTDHIQSTIPLIQSDEGTPLFNKNGEIIGINTAKQINTSVSIANNSKLLKEIQEKFNNIVFNTIDAISFNDLKQKAYYTKLNDEIKQNNISKSKWKKVSKIGNINNTIKLDLIKANYVDGIVSLRYQNNISDYVSSMQMSAEFKEELIRQGYKEMLKGNKKCIYKNKKYEVIIMEEFNYLIIMMVNL
ncbi:MAG: S1C family serine protease [Bacilli bacterium]